MFGLPAAKDGEARRRSTADAAAMCSNRASPRAAEGARNGRTTSLLMNSPSTVRLYRAVYDVVCWSLKEQCAPRTHPGGRCYARPGSAASAVTLWHLLAPHGTTGPNQVFRIAYRNQKVAGFPEQPPKLGVARSNRARVTTIPFFLHRDRRRHCTLTKRSAIHLTHPEIPG